MSTANPFSLDIRKLLLMVVGYVLCSATFVRAQVTPNMPFSGALQVYTQSWDVEENSEVTRINQSVVPIGLFLPLSNGFEARISTSYVSLTRRLPGTSAESVTGLTDLKLQANYALVNRQVLLGLSLNLPSGQSELTSQEQDVVFGFISPDLSVRANRLGEGFNVGGTLSFARVVSPTSTLGLAGGFVARGAYTTSVPGLDMFELNPGYEASITGAYDYNNVSSQFRLSAILTAQGVEQVNGIDAYQLGPQIALQGYFVRALNPKTTLTLSIQDIFRRPNSVLTENGLVAEAFSTNQNQLILFAGADVSFLPRLNVSASGTGRFIGSNEEGFGDATVFEGGATLHVIINPRILLSLGGRYISGQGTGLLGEKRTITGLEGTARTSIQF